MTFESFTYDEKEYKEVFARYENAIILVITPSHNYQTQEGTYHSALIYRGYRKIYQGEFKNVNSPNKCAIMGMLETVQRINDMSTCKNVVLLTGGSFGFKKALKFSDPNSDLWNELFRDLESKGCEILTEVVLRNGGTRVAKLCRD